MKKYKNITLFILISLLSFIAVIIKLKGNKIIGDILLLTATVSFWYFIYIAFLKRRQLSK